MTPWKKICEDIRLCNTLCKYIMHSHACRPIQYRMFKRGRWPTLKTEISTLCLGHSLYWLCCCSQENYFYICLCRSAWKKSKNQLSTSGRLNSFALHCRLSNIWVKALVFHSLQFPLIFSCNGSNWSSSNNSGNTLENVVLIRLWWVFLFTGHFSFKVIPLDVPSALLKSVKLCKTKRKREKCSSLISYQPLYSLRLLKQNTSEVVLLT